MSAHGIPPRVDWAMLHKGDRLRVQGVGTPLPDDSISYPNMLSGWKTLTKVSKPCYVISTACHSPRSAALRWCVRTPYPDIFCSLHSGFAYGKGLQSFTSSCFWVFHCFAMDSKELSSISDCFGDQKAIKTPKLNIIWLELIARVLNMLIGLKDDNYYSKVFKRINHKLSNNTFWVVIIFVKDHILSNQPWQFNIIFYEHVWSITSLSFMLFVIDYILSNCLVSILAYITLVRSVTSLCCLIFIIHSTLSDRSWKFSFIFGVEWTCTIGYKTLVPISM